MCPAHLKVLKTTAYARVEAILTPAAARRAPDCPHYPACGGCDFRHISYAEELEAKRQRVEDALRRIGGAECRVDVIHGAKETGRYRNKVQFPVAGGAIGYYQERTHRVVDIEDCLLQPELDTVCRRAVKEWMERFRVPAYDERAGKGLVRHLFLRTNSAGRRCAVWWQTGKDCPMRGSWLRRCGRPRPRRPGWCCASTHGKPT